jgi:glycosyltransferase involved in cell wall biosynthesis
VPSSCVRVSVVVPTCRRPDLLGRCLAALLTQELPPTLYEIIVADDAADDETRALVEDLAARGGCRGLVVRYVAVQGGHGPAAARNAGWRAARGGIVAFTDDDCLPDPCWLLEGLAVFRHACVAAVSGRIVMPTPRMPTDYEVDAARLQSSEFVTANCFCRRDALEAVGGFDERFPLAFREDSDLHFSLLAKGFEIGRAPGAIVRHPVRPAAWGVSLRQQRKSMCNALLFKKHPRLYRERIQPAPPLRYYVMLAALTFGASALVRRRPAAALAGSALWLALTGEFCARRLRGTSRAPRHVLEMAVTSALIPPLSVYWRLRGALKYRVLFF